MEPIIVRLVVNGSHTWSACASEAITDDRDPHRPTVDRLACLAAYPLLLLPSSTLLVTVDLHKPPSGINTPLSWDTVASSLLHNARVPPLG